MAAWPADAVIYEINTAAWLHDVSQRSGVIATLADVPAAEWDLVTPPGVDAVWLMGVWERGPAGVELAMESAEQVASFRAALPDFDATDVIGSAYCISRLRRRRAPRRAGRSAPPLAPRSPSGRYGCSSTSCPTTSPPTIDGSPSIPSTSCRATSTTCEMTRAGFIAVGDVVIARGRDPYFPPWPDVAQLNAFATGLRRAAVDDARRHRRAG